MSRAYAGRLHSEARSTEGTENGPPMPTRWGFSKTGPEAGAAPVPPTSAPLPPEPGDHPIDGDNDMPQITAAMREADAQPLPGALPTLRFWMVVLTGLVMVAAAAAVLL